jgi:hypothetical protein
MAAAGAPLPEVVPFSITMLTEVQNPAEMVSISIIGLPKELTNISFDDEKSKEVTVNIPRGRVLSLRIGVFFRALKETISVESRSQNAAGIRIHQLDASRVRADMQHRATHMAEDCELRCAGDKIGRSGRNFCIDCKISTGIVTICC